MGKRPLGCEKRTYWEDGDGTCTVTGPATTVGWAVSESSRPTCVVPDADPRRLPRVRTDSKPPTTLVCTGPRLAAICRIRASRSAGEGWLLKNASSLLGARP